jgi:hypothetical protein
MATIMTEARMTDIQDFQVVHPLDDIAEEKCSPAGLGRMSMSASVRFSLYALQGYLALIALAVGYRVLTLAGAFGHPLH